MNVTYELDKKNKHSIRYKRAEGFTKRNGPDTIYVPNEFFQDTDNPPAKLTMNLAPTK